tara:strand:+ start:1018 stop:1230 length:213 start_codon:yes stop_codon:yes gene_type:complete
MIKVGDIVKLRTGSTRSGVVTDFVDRKCWRTSEMGRAINWNKVEPEPHAVVLYDDGVMRIPVVDLEVVND